MVKGGRRTDSAKDKYRPKLDEKAKAKILGALSVGADVRIAAALVGVSNVAIYKLRKREPDFAEEMDSARALADEKVVKSLFDSARGGNVTACIFWLKNRRPDEWRDRVENVVRSESKVEYVATFEDGEAYSPTPEAPNVSAETIN